jgi:hypothetical protein
VTDDDVVRRVHNNLFISLRTAQRASNDPALVNFKWSTDGETLSISKLCKNNCPLSREADIMVIQCNASNQFDYAFSNGFINVFGMLQSTIQARVRPVSKRKAIVFFTVSP